MFHFLKNSSKMCEKHLWKNDILSEDIVHRPALFCIFDLPFLTSPLIEILLILR